MIQKTISFSIYQAYPKLTFSKGPKNVPQDKDTAQKSPNRGTIYRHRNIQGLSEVFSPTWPLVDFLFRTFHPELPAEEMLILIGAVEFLAIAQPK